jgi:hypothetical protein
VNMKKKNCAFTVCNLVYLNKALALAESYNRHTEELINIYLFDRKTDLPDVSNIANIIWIEELCLEGFDSLAFKYDVTELTTSLKPYIALDLLVNCQNVIFFDPDTYLCEGVDYIIDLLENAPIVLTPHYTIPQEPGVELTESDVGMMRFGSFNLGFFAVSNNSEAISFLKWWDKRCRDLCFFETQFGLSTDQKWVSIAPCFFPNLHISFYLGLNVSFWNLHERSVSYDTDTGSFLVNRDYKLMFFHFSSYDDIIPHNLTTRPFSVDISNEDTLHLLIDRYHATHEKYKKLLVNISKRYTFDYMSDGSYISPVLRRAYSSVFREFPDNHAPFEANGIVGRFVKKNKLQVKRILKYRPASLNDLDDNNVMYYFILLFMRVVLRVIGPVRFSNFSRLLVYLSSYRQVKGLWRI